MAPTACRIRLPTERKWPYTASWEVGLIDTHCHLDYIFNRSCHTGTFAQFRLTRRNTFPYCYGGCVANFCDPATFQDRRLWGRLLAEECIWGAFGCHPRRAGEYTDDVEQHLIRALNHRSVVALGEIGLDYARRDGPDPEQQQRVFRRQLALAVERQLPLVIHSRDSTPDTIRVLKETVRADHPIHLHCFTGDWMEARTWLDTFPRLCLGLTPVLGFPGAEPLVEAARNIPLDRLLFETDAPFFLPWNETGKLKCSHPGMVVHVVTELSHIRNEPIEEVVAAVRQNTRRIYGI